MASLRKRVGAFVSRLVPMRRRGGVNTAKTRAKILRSGEAVEARIKGAMAVGTISEKFSSLERSFIGPVLKELRSEFDINRAYTHISSTVLGKKKASPALINPLFQATGINATGLTEYIFMLWWRKRQKKV